MKHMGARGHSLRKTIPSFSFEWIRLGRRQDASALGWRGCACPDARAASLVDRMSVFRHT